MVDMLKDITYISIEDLTNPRDGEVMSDRWWIVDPEKGALVFKGFSPQCNRNELITRRLLEMYPGCEARHIPFAYVGRLRGS